MRYYLIAGERSGDQVGARLIDELSQLDKGAEFRGIGGEEMSRSGMVLFRDIKGIEVMGFVEVTARLLRFLRLMKNTRKDMASFYPDVLILIDYPGFNLRMAKWASSHGIKVIYYISPQVWAWKRDRALKMETYVDHLISILPFEEEFFGPYDLTVSYAGHPLVERIEGYKSRTGRKIDIPQDKPVIALLPGSRRQEIKRILPVMSRIARYFLDYRFIVAGISGVDPDFYEKYIDSDLVKVVYDKTYDLLSVSQAAVVTSGTATLEAALFEVPQVVCYRGNAFSYRIAKRLVHVKYISLVNLLLDRPLLKELIQNDFHENNLKDELQKVLPGSIHREEILEGYKGIRNCLGEGSASKKAAEIVYNSILND